MKTEKNNCERTCHGDLREIENVFMHAGFRNSRVPTIILYLLAIYIYMQYSTNLYHHCPTDVTRRSAHVELPIRHSNIISYYV